MVTKHSKVLTNIYVSTHFNSEIWWQSSTTSGPKQRCKFSMNSLWLGWLTNKNCVWSKHVYYLGWNRSPAQVGCTRQVLGPGALGRPRGIGWRGSWEGGSGWGTHVNPWLIHFNVWQNPLQKKKRIVRVKSLQLCSTLCDPLDCNPPGSSVHGIL